jgi:hypothetical protein
MITHRFRYFSASSAEQPKKHCVGVARSTDILGPYDPQASPMICPLSRGGAIDASGYNDNGQRYVVYKVVSVRSSFCVTLVY